MWKTVKLGNICETLDNLRKPIRKKDRISGAYPYYGASGIIDKVASYIFDEKLVLVGEDGAKWGAGDQTAFIIEGKAWVNNHVHVLRPLTHLVMHEWLSYYLTGIDLSPWVTGLTVTKLNQTQLRSIPIPLPVLPEQQRIVARLDSVFAEIDKAKIIANAKEIEIDKLKATLLVNEFNSSQTNTTQRKIKLSDVCIINNGGTPKSSENSYWGGNIQWITPKDMSRIKTRYVSSTERQISISGLANSSAKVIPERSVILSSRAPIGYAVINEVDMAFSQGCKGLVPKEDITVEYLYYFLTASKQLLNELGTGATFKEISAKKLSDIQIVVPALPEQRCITAKLDLAFSELDKAKAALAKSKTNYQALKSAILRQELHQEAV